MERRAEAAIELARQGSLNNEEGGKSTLSIAHCIARSMSCLVGVHLEAPFGSLLL